MRSVELQQQPVAAWLDQLESIAALPEDWDSYGAARIAAVAVTTARELLKGLVARPRAAKLLPFHVAPISTDRPAEEPRIVERHLPSLAAAIQEIEAFVV